MGLPIRIKRLVLAGLSAPLMAAMVIVTLAGPSSAAPRARTTEAAVAAPDATTVFYFRTLAKALHVRKNPRVSAKSVAVLKHRTRVGVTCFTYGTPVYGDSIWYYIVSPKKGYVAGYWLNTGRDPAKGVPACGVNRNFRTIAKALHVRKAPRTSSTSVAVLKRHTRVTVNCYRFGTPVFGDSIWYHIVSPNKGFVAGYWLNTGRDPARGVVHC
ncbi:MAG TPA: SH3 domain-containing protein [Streptosporangiaceae bacterium]|jgi:hypothetical protein|nr:SH3 domain-containing protein [Streptosporangiaceae bacterium]